jgi:hypothetical protein
LGSALATQSGTGVALTALIDRASSALAGARTAAEILEARDMASVAYDAAKKAARFSKAKDAADDLIRTAYRVQADALDIEAGAKRRLADEYDAAQARGEVVGATAGAKKRIPEENSISPATVKEIGLTSKDIHEARLIRDAEAETPGIVRQALDAILKCGEEPTKAKVRRTILKAPKHKKRTRGPRFVAPKETQHDRDLRALLGVWESACESAREEFFRTVTEKMNG